MSRVCRSVKVEPSVTMYCSVCTSVLSIVGSYTPESTPPATVYQTLDVVWRAVPRQSLRARSKYDIVPGPPGAATAGSPAAGGVAPAGPAGATPAGGQAQVGTRGNVQGSPAAVLVAPAGPAAATAKESMHKVTTGGTSLRSLRLAGRADLRGRRGPACANPRSRRPPTCANPRIGTSGSPIGTLWLGENVRTGQRPARAVTSYKGHRAEAPRRWAGGVN